MYLDLAGLRNETETANNMHVASPLLDTPILLTMCLECTSTHAQTIK